jgi:hypothetical protein
VSSECLMAMVRRTSDPQVEDCAACHRSGTADTLWPTLCRQCAGKLRSADGRAASAKGIREDMLRDGIPLGQRRSNKEGSGEGRS